MPSFASWIEKKFLSGPAIADRDASALEIGELGHAGFGAAQHAHAATMGAGGDLDVKALLQWFQPAQRHAETGIALSGGDRFEQLVGRAGIVDELDIKILLLEKAVLDRDRQRRKADRAGIPRQFQLARRA